MAKQTRVNKHTGKALQLGWRPTPPERLARIPRFKTYVHKMSAGVLPAEFDYSDSAKASFLQMLGNNIAGDCTIAAVLKQAGLASANRPGPKELVSSDREALQQYPTICGPGDQGCYIPDVLDYWRDEGLMVGGVKTRILGYVLVDPTNELETAKALFLSGSLHCGLMISQQQYDEAAPDAVWDADTSPIIGGHSIPLAGRKKAGWRMGTWGMKCFITSRALADPRAQTELYAVIDEQWFGQGGLNSFGVDAAHLQSDLAVIAGGGDVPIPDPTPTPVPPGPQPGPGPAPLWQWAHDFNLFGFTLSLTAALSHAPASGSVSANWWDVASAAWAIVHALRAGDWTAAAQALTDLITALGQVLAGRDVPHLRQMMQGARKALASLPAQGGAPESR